MEDRFNFRIWDKPTETMFDTCCLGHIAYAVKQPWACVDSEYGQIDYTKDRLNDIIIMQCTGLKDKNGKLIYEGDIITRPNDKYSDNYEVFYNQELFCWGLKIEGDVIDSLSKLKNVIDEYEVIGNIYKNKELLND